MYIYSRIFGNFFGIFPARKTIYLNISGIYLLSEALLEPMGIFSVFLRFFLEFFSNFLAYNFLF